MSSISSIAKYIVIAILAYYWLNYIKHGPVYNSNKSLKGKTVLITGGNAGIGKATVLGLAKLGARIIIASRNVSKSESTKEEIILETNNRNIEVQKLDLSNFENVRSFVESYHKNEEYLDILINNAGVVDLSGNLPSGLGRMYAVNHFGHFLLTFLLLDKMKAQSSTRPVRIINLTSKSYMFGSFDEDLLFKNPQSFYEFHKIYASTKLANIYFTAELYNHLIDYTNISTYSIHPGLISTDIGNNFAKSGVILYDWVLRPLFGRNTFYGAQTVLYCALDDDVVHFSGEYFSDCARQPLEDCARNKTLQKHIWQRSMEITGLKKV